MVLRPCLRVLLLLLSLLHFAAIATPAIAQSDNAAAPASKVDTARGDRMLADYFKAQTARIAEQSLADIKTLDDWKTKRETYRAQLFEMLGLAKLPPKTDLKPVITGTLDHAEFTVEKLHFQSSPGLYVTGNLYIPKNLEADKPAPAILYLCGHSAQKKDNISFGNKAGYQHHGAWFAQHGYVCLVIDSLQLGEIEGIHHGTYRYGMWWWINRGYTPAGVEAWNCIRALDYLETRKEVDKNRIGVTGRSGGGAYSWWITALDDRIKVAVPVAGITDLQNYVVDACVEGHCDCMFMHNTYQWDYAQVAALVAPRPLLISNTDKDTIFPLDGVYRVHEKVKKIYQLHGAEKNLGFHITEGPHKDTQELRIHALVWFDRYLRKEEREITKPAEKLFEPEQLRVFEKLPGDEVNTKIQETFVQDAGVVLTVEKEDWPVQSERRMKQLKENVFMSWPVEAVPLKLREVSSDERDGIVFKSYDFTSQEHVDLKLFVAYRNDIGQSDLVVLNVLDDQAWIQWLSWSRGLWGKVLESEAKVKQDEQAIAQNIAQNMKMLKSTKWAMAYIAPRGVGPTAFDASAKKQTQNRRRYMLLGQTLDEMQTWDIRCAVQAVREMNAFKGVPLWLQSERVMAGNVLYASLFEPDIARLDLWHLPLTHRDGPIYMNISKHMDMREALAMAAARSPVRLYQADEKGWEYVKSVGDILKWDAKQLQVRVLPSKEEK